MEENKPSRNLKEVFKVLSILLPLGLGISIVRFKESGCVGFGAGGTLCGDGVKTWLIVLGVLAILSIIGFIFLKIKDK